MMCQKAKNWGGLGIKNVRMMNVCLLLKWWWQYGIENKALWRRVIDAKYGVGQTSWIPITLAAVKSSRVWADILLLQKRLPDVFRCFSSNVKLKIGSGANVSFWKDSWVGNSLLKMSFQDYLIFQFTRNVE